MKNKEIIEYLDGIEKFICTSACDSAEDPTHNCNRCRDHIAFSFAKKDVKKQIGMKPKNVRIDGLCGFRCHRCKQQVWINYLYCPNCCQRLEWEDQVRRKCVSEWESEEGSE